MGKKNNKTSPRPAPVATPKKEIVTETPFAPDPKIPAWLYSFKFQAVVVGLIAFALYFNTFKHEYALDDTIVIAKNEYVYEGFAGIWDIMSKDAFDSYYRQFNSSNQLSGGRFRPLSIATFAIEQQFLGPVPKSKVDSVVSHAGEMGPQEQQFNKNMHVRHVVNVLLYALSMITLLYFLRYVVFKNPLMAFVAAILFTMHPIHTEVVANVKSRDEIMSLLFLCLTFIFAFRSQDEKDKKWLLWAGLGSYLLAFLSKEYAVGMIVLLPLSFYLFKRYTLTESVKVALPYFAVLAFYLVIRLQVVGPKSADAEADILNNPYALANESQQLATKISTTLNYLKLLLFPHPLSADYSYNTIPYKDFTNPIVWLSLVIHIGMIRMFFYFLKRPKVSKATIMDVPVAQNLDYMNGRNILCFAIAFYLVNVLLICNIIFNIGGTMGERLIYHSSVGFCIAVAYLLFWGAQKIRSEGMGRVALAGCVLLIMGLCGFKTIDRARFWKNDHTLFFEDIKVAPNSVLVNADVASSYVNLSDTKKTEAERIHDVHMGIAYFSKAIEINPSFVSGYLNRGMAYFKLKRPDSALYNLNKVKELYPRYPKLDEMYFNVGVNFYMEKQFPQAINVWQTVVRMSPPGSKIHNDAQNALAVMVKEGHLR